MWYRGKVARLSWLFGRLAVSTHTNMLIVIADGEHARFVRDSEDGVLRTQVGLDSIAAHQRSSSLGSDRPGASFHTGSTAHHAMTPRHDPHAQQKSQFAELVAQQVNAATGEEGFQKLILVAPAHVLQAIGTELHDDVRGRIVGCLAKDLVKTPDDALRPHLQEWLPPAHRVGSILS
jgi:protein required for attachment to host cells